jgi:hypothetical protein
MGMAFLFSLITRVTQLAVEGSGINFDNISSYIWIITPLVPLGFGVMLLSMIGMGALAGVALAQSERREANFWPFFRRGLERLPTLVAVLLLSGVGISLGFMCLIIPGIVLMLMWSMVGPVAVLEDKGIIGTFSRSKELTTNVLWRIFLVLMIVNIGTSIFSWVVTALVGPFFSGADNRLVLGSGPEAFLLLTITDTLAMAVTLAAGVDRIQVDFGLEKDRGRRFALWALLHMLGAAPDLDVAFKDEADRNAARTFMELAEQTDTDD